MSNRLKTARIICFWASAICTTALGADVFFVPVSSTGSHQLLAPNIIYIPQGGVRATFDFYVANWDPDGDGNPKIRTIQVRPNLGSYGNSNSPSALSFPEVVCTTNAQCNAAYGANGVLCGSNHSAACMGATDCCEAFYIDPTRPDWFLAGINGVCAVETSSARVGCSTDPGEELIDDGTRKYLGSVVLDVPANSVGEFTLTFDEQQTFLVPAGPAAPPGSNWLPLDLSPAKVFVGVPATTEYKVKPRYFVFNSSSEGDAIHGYAVRLTSLHHPARPAPSPYQTADFTPFEGQIRWVGPETSFTMSPSYPQHVFSASRLQCQSHFSNAWSGQPLAIFGAEVIPDSVYEVKGFFPSCTDFDTCGFSVGTFTTGRWADVVPPFEVDQLGSQPDLSDISAMLDRFRSLFGCPSKAQSQLQGNIPDPSVKVNFVDISEAVNAFRGYAYPYPGPTTCP